MQALRRRGLASVGVEPLHVVVLPSSKAAATGGGAPGPWHGGAPVGGRLLAGVREALSKATQVLPVTCWGRESCELGAVPGQLALPSSVATWTQFRRARLESTGPTGWGGALLRSAPGPERGAPGVFSPSKSREQGAQRKVASRALVAHITSLLPCSIPRTWLGEGGRGEAGEASRVGDTHAPRYHGGQGFYKAGS